MSDSDGSLRSAYACTLRDHPLRCRAKVVLPDQPHTIRTELPGGVRDAERWRPIKSRRAPAPAETVHPRLPQPGKARP